MQICICHGALNKCLFDQYLYLTYFGIYATQKCQHCQLCVLRENSINFYGFSLSSSEKPKYDLPISGNPTRPGGRFVCRFLSNSSKQTAVARKPVGAKYRIECKAPILK